MAFGKVFKPPFNKVFSTPFGSAGSRVPSDVASLNIWHDASDATTITATGSSVDELADKQGSTDLTQTGTARPSTGVVTINGLNAIGFDGTNDYLLNASFAVTTSCTTMHAVNVQTVTGTFESIFSFDATNDFQVDANSNTQFLCQVNTTLFTAISGATNLEGTTFLCTVIFDFVGGTVELRINGVSIATTSDYTTAIDTTQAYCVGVNRGLNQFLEMSFGEGLVFNAALTGADLADMESYMINKWGV